MNNDEAIIASTECEMCGADKGDPCVYMPTLYPSAKNADKVGQPTKRVHGARSVVWTDRRERAAKAKANRLRIEQAKQVPPAIRDLISIREAHRAFEQREDEAMIDWLRQHAGVLTGATS